MRIKQLLLILTLILLTANCKKEDKEDYSQYYRRYSYVEVNGVPWEWEGPSRSYCPALHLDYNDSSIALPNNSFLIALKRCNTGGDSLIIPFRLALNYNSIFSAEDFVDSNFNYRHFQNLEESNDELGVYDSVLSGYFIVHEFRKPDFTCSCSPYNRGYLNAEFEYDFLNRAGTDTVHIRNGKINANFYFD